MSTNPAFRTFLGLYLGLFLLALLGVWSYDKGSLVIWINQFHAPHLDTLFKYVTYLGDGACLGLLCLSFCLFRYKYAIILTVIGLSQLLTSFLTKKILFGKTPRPAAFFKDTSVDLHFVEGVRVHHWYSFPSGHSITAFGLFFFVALVNEKRSIAVACFFIATLAAFSRIYLVQHFLLDILVGSATGIFLTGIIYYLAYLWEPFWQHQRLNRPMA